MLRFTLPFLCAKAGLLASLHFEDVTDPSTLAPSITKMLHETEMRQQLDIPLVNRREFAYAVFTPKGEMAGGVQGYTDYDQMHLNILAANPDCRVRGTGTKMLQAVELEARTKYGCNRIALETFSWQARSFYEKYGYKVFGVLRDHPTGHEKYFMEKVWPRDKMATSDVVGFEKASEELTVELTDVPKAVETVSHWIDKETLDRSVPGVPPYDMTPLGLKVTDAAGTLVACCTYDTWWDAMHIGKLVVSPEMQQQGIGSATLRKLESMAQEKKLRHIVAESMSWQAYPFFEKYGYKIFARQADIARGHAHLLLQRRID